MANVYRDEALKNLSVQDRINEMLRPVPIHFWISTCGIILVLLTFFFWAFLGTISIRIDGLGILMPSEGTRNIYPSSSGYLKRILIKEGDILDIGDTIGFLDQTNVFDKIRVDSMDMQSTKIIDEKRMALLSQTKKQIIRTYSSEIENKKKHLSSILEQIEFGEKVYLEKENSFKAGLVGKKDLYEYKNTLDNLIREKMAIEIEISSLHNKISQTNNDYNINVLQISERLNLRQHEHNSLKRKLFEETVIISDYKARVIEVSLYEGQFMTPADKIGVFEILSDEMAAKNHLGAKIFIPAVKSKKLHPGMKAYLSPSGFDPDEYGYVISEVASTAYYPLTAEGVQKEINNNIIAQSVISKYGEVVAIEINLITNNSGEVIWSSKKSIGVSIQSGQMCSAQIEIEKKHPIELLLPVIKKKLIKFP